MYVYICIYICVNMYIHTFLYVCMDNNLLDTFQAITVTSTKCESPSNRYQPLLLIHLTDEPQTSDHI